MIPGPVFVMVGLPESGKSTYLGALYHALLRAPKHGLHLVREPDERDYLLDLQRRWLSLKPLKRSVHHGAKQVEIPIGTSEDGSELMLAIPDVVGEDYHDAWLHGNWRGGLPEWLCRADGLLLFLRADNVRDATLISVDPSRDVIPRGSAVQRDAQVPPTQAMLCDVLEQIRETRGGAMAPVATVVAAWDTAADTNLTPEDWLAWQTPLLSQWLRANESEVPFSIFGISAQGGDLRDEDIRKRLADQIEERPLPKHGSPLIAPVQWLLEHYRFE